MLPSLGYSWHIGRRRFSKIVVDELPIALPATLDLFLRHGRCPNHAIVADPVMRAAAKAPVADRRPQGNRLAVEQQLPACGMNRRNHLRPTAADTEMRGRGEGHGDVEG